MASCRLRLPSRPAQPGSRLLGRPESASRLGIWWRTGLAVSVTSVLPARSSSPQEEMFLTQPLTSKRIAEAETIVREKHPDAQRAAPEPNVQRFRQMRHLLIGTVAGVK
ncbi:MAG: hypothetical protein AMK72_01220 [Planctomycetes bacterium SM23_25]|nr:MAG: hypothetical protein AMK72_01220 [Planctomycetes bacterium SM23_25]